MRRIDISAEKAYVESDNRLTGRQTAALKFAAIAGAVWIFAIWKTGGLGVILGMLMIFVSAILYGLIRLMNS